MSERNRLLVLRGELQKTLERIDAIEGYYRQFRIDYPAAGVTRDCDLVILADLLSDYYTCLETAFVRIARHFENELLESLPLVRRDLSSYGGFLDDLVRRMG